MTGTHEKSKETASDLRDTLGTLGARNYRKLLEERPGGKFKGKTIENASK